MKRAFLPLTRIKKEGIFRKEGGRISGLTKTTVWGQVVEGQNKEWEEARGIDRVLDIKRKEQKKGKLWGA